MLEGNKSPIQSPVPICLLKPIKHLDRFRYFIKHILIAKVTEAVNVSSPHRIQPK